MSVLTPTCPAGAHDFHDETDPNVTAEMPTRVDAVALRQWLTRPDRPRIIDVRSAAEFAGVHIPGAYNVPLPLLKEHTDELRGRLDEQIVLICRTDNRACQAEEALKVAGLSDVHVLSGGMNAWQESNGPVTQGEGRWDLERQVRLVAGSIVASGILASTVVPKAKWVSGFVGCGLVFAAVTDSCAMGQLLSKLPYNKNAEPGVDEVVSALSR